MRSSAEVGAGSSAVLVPARAPGPALASPPPPQWAGGAMGGFLGALERPDVPRSVGGSNEARKPVWRQNKRPWYVRAVLDVRIGSKTRPIVSDVSLDDWLEVFRADLGA